MGSYDSSLLTRRDTPEEWLQYLAKIHLLQDTLTGDETILEIGCGRQLIADFFRRQGYTWETVDIDPAKAPDYQADILDWTPPHWGCPSGPLGPGGFFRMNTLLTNHVWRPDDAE